MVSAVFPLSPSPCNSLLSTLHSGPSLDVPRVTERGCGCEGAVVAERGRWKSACETSRLDRELRTQASNTSQSASLLSTIIKRTSSNICARYQAWLGCRVVSVLDSGAEGSGFKSQLRRCRVTVLGKLFTLIVPLFSKQKNCSSHLKG